MKKALIGFAMIMLMGIAYNCSEKEMKETNCDLMELGFHGNIESIKVSKYELSSKFGEEILGDNVSVEYYKFNDKGMIVEECEYDENGVLDYKYIYTYDGNGNLMDESEYDDGMLDYKCIYTYDGNGNLIEESGYDEDGALYSKCIYTYDDMGCLIKKCKYNEYGVLNYKYIYTYDGNGNLIEESGYDEDGALYSKYIYTYDDIGCLIEKCYNKYGVDYKYKYIYTYDDMGCLIEESKNIEEGVDYSYVYIYDANGNLMEECECYIVDEKFVYDDKGNLIEEYKNHDYENKQGRKKYIYTLEEGSLKRVFDFDKDGKYTYTYDDKGNLIEVVVYFFGGHIFTNYNYDDKGNLIETQIDYKTIFGGAKNIIKYIYDNDGYLIKEYTMIKEKKGGIEGILEEMGELGVGVGLSDAQCNVDTIDYAIYMYNMGKLVKKSRYYYSTSVEESFDEYGKPISLIGEYVYDDKGNIYNPKIKKCIF